MTTSRQFAEHEGKLDKRKPTGDPCPKCKVGREMHQTWESSCGGYEDSKYTCSEPGCSYVRWVDGDDG